MAPDQYAGDAGTARKREDEERNSSAAQAVAQAVRRDLIARLPYGRALDLEDLAYKLDQGSMDNKSLVFRQRVLDEWRKQLPGGVVLGSHDVERLRADSETDPKQTGEGPGIPEWPTSR
jgi:hypothetical protein